MSHTRFVLYALFVATLLFVSLGVVAPPAQAQSSQNVAYIDSQYVANGGVFPFATNLAFSGFNFYHLAGS